MATEPNNPGLAGDPLAPKRRDEVDPNDRGANRGDPYGPQEYGDDTAAGGADSSPHENEPTGERTVPPPQQTRGGPDNRNS